MKNKSIIKSPGGLIFQTLEGYLSLDEIENIKEIIDSGISVESISNKFSPDRAKDFQEIFFRKRNSLKLTNNENSINFFIACSEYYENSIKNNVSFSMESLTPEGMCDLKSWGPLQYPYP